MVTLMMLVVVVVMIASLVWIQDHQIEKAPTSFKFKNMNDAIFPHGYTHYLNKVNILRLNQYRYANITDLD